MKNLWAPWRIEYILDDKKEDECFLCNALSEKDEKNFILKRTKNAFAIMNKYPYGSGHIMIAPKRHIGALEDLTKDEYLELMNLLVDIKKALDDSLCPDAYNIGLNLGKYAGAGLLEHLHWHIVPRWEGDTNFMPVISDVRVLPEYIKVTYEKICAILKS